MTKMAQGKATRREESPGGTSAGWRYNFVLLVQWCTIHRTQVRPRQIVRDSHKYIPYTDSSKGSFRLNTLPNQCALTLVRYAVHQEGRADADNLVGLNANRLQYRVAKRIYLGTTGTAIVRAKGCKGSTI